MHTQDIFNVRILRKGEPYGLNDKLTWDKDEPAVEFYDARYPHTKRGQFITRYYLSTVLAGEGGIDLCGGIPAWSVNGYDMAKIREYLKANTKED